MSIVDVNIPEQLDVSRGGKTHASPRRFDARHTDRALADGGRAHRVGAKVAVRNRYLGTWSPGFEVAALHRDGYRIRRASDGAVFGEVIAFGDVREPFGPTADR
ncbi:MAG TPA: hypothetical protein VMV22_07365 [Acidimicrobiales bacterium]|nr:hypothetical protein [Acidimicrobiales bacterium]